MILRMLYRGGSRIFFRRGCTRLLLYFNANKPHSILQNTNCIRKPQVISGEGAHPLHPPPRSAPALEHINKCVFAHNDLETNHVVLEKRDDQVLHPVIIDFGKSVAFSKANNPVPKPAHLKGKYKNSYIAPEPVDGPGKPSIESDVYLLAFMIQSVNTILKFKNTACG